MDASVSPVTRMLRSLAPGESRPPDELFSLVYEELRALAHARLRHERPGLTLQATALVHEAFLRLVANDPGAWENRGHFFGAAAEAMRRILIERARRYASEKHGAGRRRVELDESATDRSDAPVAGPRDHAFGATPEEIVALDESLQRLQAQDPRMAEVVTLRCFAGLTVEQVAEALALSVRSVERLWTGARAWLRRDLSQSA